MATLSSLIARCDWDSVYQRIHYAPKECSMPIPTSNKETVYPLHQAVCAKGAPIPYIVLELLLSAYPSALDLNVFIGASENPQLSRVLMEILLSRSSCDLNESVEQNAERFVSKAVKKNNISLVQFFIERFPCILKSGSIQAYVCKHGTAEMVEETLCAGHRQNVGIAGGLYIKTNNKEDALDITIRLYNKNDDNRRNIRVTCLQYANAAKMGKGLPQ